MIAHTRSLTHPIPKTNTNTAGLPRTLPVTNLELAGNSIANVTPNEEVRAEMEEFEARIREWVEMEVRWREQVEGELRG